MHTILHQHLNTPGALQRIESVNRPGKSSAEVQDTFLEFARNLGFESEKKGLFGWHNNAVYDSRHKALVVFGTNRNSNAIVVYRPDTGEHQKMRTPRPRPPRDQHAPMAYHPIIDRTVVLVDFKPSWLKKPYWTTHTWLYDLGKDAWTPAKSALLPFPAGMNYNMAYDPGHELLLLVANRPNRPTTVWALRLKR